jgi:hypothetical protein
LRSLLEVGLAVAAVDAALEARRMPSRMARGAGAALDAAVLEDRERVLPDDDGGRGALDVGRRGGEARPGGLAALLGGDAGLDLGALGQEAVEPLGLLGGEGGVAGLGVDGAQLACDGVVARPELGESHGVSFRDRIGWMRARRWCGRYPPEWLCAGSVSVVRAASAGSEVPGAASVAGEVRSVGMAGARSMTVAVGLGARRSRARARRPSTWGSRSGALPELVGHGPDLRRRWVGVRGEHDGTGLEEADLGDGPLGHPVGVVSDGPGSSFHSSLMTWNRKTTRRRRP